MGGEVRRVDHDRILFAMLGSQICHHLGEDTLVAPPLPAIIQRLVRAIGRRRITPA